MGKAATTEFANRHPARTRHPLNPAHTPGGSSSGSAAAVADCMVPIAIGTQTTGSTIKPGSFCGVFAFKPTHGELSCAGVKESARSLDTIGLYARSIEDIELYRAVLLGIAPKPLPASDGAGPRIGFCRTPNWHEADPCTQNLLEEAAGRLSQRGARVSDLELSEDFDRLCDAQQCISAFEFSRNYTWEIEHHWNEISSTLRHGRLKFGLECSLERYRDARQIAARCRRSLEALFADFDVLLTPAASGEAPVGLESTGNSSFCAMWTTAHVPALTIPVFSGPAGLPVGAQLIGAHGNDRNLLAFAKWIYRELV